MTIKDFTGFAAGIFITFSMSCSHNKKLVSKAPVLPPVQAPHTAGEQEDDFMLRLFKTRPSLFDSIIANKNKWNVQVIYTQINRDKAGNPSFVTHQFNNHPDRYFYPASTVKLPVALLALQKLKQLNIAGLHKYSSMITEAATAAQTAVYNDPNSADGCPSVAQYIKKILLVSDNDAFNRLYEFVGQEAINRQLNKMGYSQTQIIHRLNIFLPEQENRSSNPIYFTDSNNNVLYRQPMQVSKLEYARRKDSLGHAYYSNGALVNSPMDFSKKNRLPLEELHGILRSIIFPESVPAAQRFDISEADRKFVLQYMSQYPRESAMPAYDPAVYPDAFGKMILFGNAKENVPPQIRSFSKAGWAYGQLTETAYIIDTLKKVEFMVSATINCNTDGIYNDDKYDWQGLGYPFMKNLGLLLYHYELNRDRKYAPNFDNLLFSYN